MEKQIQELIDAIKADYSNWKNLGPDGKINQKMIDRFNDGLGFKVGKKYIKITEKGGGSVWGFVVNVDNDPKFKKGDILKAAGWATPARNQARGNIIEGNFDWVQWTGPAYLI
jgi:hypothetical protein